VAAGHAGGSENADSASELSSQVDMAACIGTKSGGERWPHMNYWIPATILLSWVVFVFAMRERIGPATMRIRTKLRNRVGRRAAQATPKTEPVA
jgi:hypothetical protein